MKTRYCLLLLLFALPVKARDVGGDFAVLGMGGQPCADYLKARRAHAEREQNYVDWLLGYLSAFNLIVSHTYNVLGENDINDALSWLDQQCLATPKAHFVNASAVMTEVLFERRANLHPDKAGGRERWRATVRAARGESE
jgi:hypothetical protein